MASSSSSTSTDAKACSYDVFLSFSGEDTRHSFTDHLYDKLIHAGICTFRDNEEINKGEQLKPEIEKAIKESRASIVVLSKNYAASTWCLDELKLILEQRRYWNHFVLPVFYGVDPTDVRNHRGSFGIQVNPSSSKWTEHNVGRWKAALTEVADLSGEVVSGPETKILKNIIDTIYNLLVCKEIRLPSNITGIVTRYEYIKTWLSQPNLQLLAIHGMGGSGKTTLAKYIYNSNWKTFKYVSFVEHISSRCEKHSGLVEVQEQLHKDILGGNVPGIFRGPPTIAEALKMKRALIVLDDVVGYSQLVDILDTGEINPQSKIIVTTRENTDNWPDFPYWRCLKYEMGLLNDDESSELLCRHAFRSEHPKEGFHEVVQRSVQYCEGNPLALEVLGSSLFKSGSIQYWESQLRLLERDIDFRVQGVLKRSYDLIPISTVKKLFLHIACFFNGMDMNYVVNILEPDYSAISGIEILINRCLLSVSPDKKLKMHRLVEEMGKNIVRQESDLPAKRSRVWLSGESYKILKKGIGSEMVEGLALDMKMLPEENFAFKSSELNTNALQNMDSLKLLQLNYVEVSGSYEKFSEDLRWLCWLGFHLKTIPSDLYMGNLVAIDMSYSNLEVFEPPMVLHSLQILNLKDSHNLLEIYNIFMMPCLETLILWNCDHLVICSNIRDLKRLRLLNMSGCTNLFKHIERVDLCFPPSLHRLFLKDCHLDCTDSFPLSFSFQPDLQYLNLGNSLFESLPCYNHLENLLVLDLSFCFRLKRLICLPNTLAELYVYGCDLLERITFQSSRFTLQEFGYLGCTNLYEVEGFIKLVPIAKLDETELGHMLWLQQYQYHQMCLVGNDELTVGRSWHIQMLTEFDIMSTSLPTDIKDPSMNPEYISKSSSLSIRLPPHSNNKRLKGINVSFKYELSGDDWAWFCKISTSNFEVMYNPIVFGRPEAGEGCTWLSYWPIGNKLNTGDKIHVFIVNISGLEVHECGVSFVYSDQETLKNYPGGEDLWGGDLAGFQLSTGAYYLCRRDFYELMEDHRLTPNWFRILVGDTIDYTEVRGWRKTGRPKHVNPSFTEVKTIRCIIHGPQLEDIYQIAEMCKSSIADNTVPFASSLVKGEIIEETMEEIYDKQYKPRNEIDQFPFPDNTDPYSHGRILNSGSGGGEMSPLSTSARPCRVFTLAEIKSATRDFNDGLVIGEDGFGRVYRGQLSRSGLLVAIKRYNILSNQWEHEFRTEIDTLRKFHHYNMVSLIGYCDDDDEKIIVYEYMKKGTLNHHLHKAHIPLSWVLRLKIAIGAARGLDYLHAGLGTGDGVIHCDVKSSNILLNENWEAVISGFGLSMIGPSNEWTFDGDGVKGTFGYLDPEYFATGELTWKTDVYSFGVVLFELLSGRLPIERGNEGDDTNLVLWAKKCVKKGKLHQMVDPNIKGTISTECLRGFTQIADRCVHEVSSERPTMSEIVTSLEALLEVQEKSNSSTGPSGIRGFAWKIFKYIKPATKLNSGIHKLYPH